MKHFVRIALGTLIVGVGAAFVRSALGFDSEFMGSGWEGLFDLGLMAIVVLLVSFSDREYFWPTAADFAEGKNRSRPTR